MFEHRFISILIELYNNISDSMNVLSQVRLKKQMRLNPVGYKVFFYKRTTLSDNVSVI